MVEAAEHDIDEIVEYLHKGVQDCIYMFVDIKKYRLSNPAMRIWIDKDENNQLTCVVMKYHTGVSVYAETDTYPSDEVIQLIRDLNPMSITAKKTIVEKIEEAVGSQYNVLYGYVFRVDSFNDFGGNDLVELANEDDMLECAKLIVSNEEIGSYYEIENLAEQLRERIRTGMGRNYIIRDNGKIIGHIASYAELDDVATTSALIVDHEHEGKMYGAVLESYIVNQLRKEGFNVYTYIIQKKRFRLLKNIGNNPVGEYGKMMRIEA